MALPYSTFAEVQQKAGGPERLVQLADYDRDGVADPVEVADAVAEADEWIHTFARQRSNVPYDTVPESIRHLSSREAVYILKRRRDTDTDKDERRHLEDLEWLTMLAEGKVSVGTDPLPPKSGHVKGRQTDRPGSKKVSRDKLQGYG